MNGPTFAPATTPAAAPKPAAAPPRSAAPGKTAARPDADAPSGMRVLAYLRLHWLMILFCGTLLGGVGAFVAWDLLASKYESYGLLQVNSVPATLGSVSREQARTDFATYMRTTAALLKYEFVLNAALRDLKDVPTIRDQKDPIKFLAEELQISASDGSEVIKVSFAGRNPADSKRIVDAVQNAFIAEVVQKDVDQKRQLLRRVQEAQDRYREQLLQRSPKDKKPDPKPGDPVVLPKPGDPLPTVDPAIGPVAMPPAGASDVFQRNPGLLVGDWVKYRGQMEELPLKIAEAKRRLAVIVADMEAIKKAPIEKATIDAVERDGEIVAQAILVRDARSRYNFALSAAGNDATAPAVMELRKVVTTRELALARMKQDKIDSIEGAKRTAEAKQLKAEWDATKQRVDAMEEQLATAKARFAQTERLLLELPPPEKMKFDAKGLPVKDQYDAALTDLTMTDGVFAGLVRQYHMTKLELDSPERVRIIQPGSTPTQRDTKKQVMGTVAAGLMGYVLIALGVIGYEMAGKRVSSLADLKAAGPAPVVGVIPCQPTEAIGRNPAKRAAANESIDKLRAYVAQTWLSRGATTVAVTSPLGDEGKAFVAFGLASSLAQAGYKTLLVDFDLREPSLHTYAGAPNQNGVCELLRSEIDTRSAVQFLPSGLHLLPAGKWSDEARQAAVGGKLEALLGRLKGPYDCVVLHGHALLTVAESVEVARRCEVVLVCARYRETKSPMLRKATDRVSAMEIPYSGVVYVGATDQEALC